MPSPRVLNLNPQPRTELTHLEKTLSGFSDRFRENQIQKRETDALKEIYSEYQNDGKNIEKAIQAINTRTDLGATTKVNTVKQLMDFQTHNVELQKKAQLDAEKAEKKANQAVIAKDLQEKRGFTPEQANAYAANPTVLDKVYPKDKQKNTVGGLGGIPLTPEESNAIADVVKQNPDATAEELELAFNQAGIPPGRIGKILESRRRGEETAVKKRGEEKKENQRQKEFFHEESKKFDESLSEQSIAAEKKNRALENQLKLVNKLGNWDRIVSSLAGQSKWGDLLKSSNAQEFDSYSLPQMEGLRQILGGVLSDSDIRLIMQKVVTSSKTPEANEKIAKYLMSENNYILDKKNISDEVKRNNQGYRPYDYQDQINRIFKERYGDQIKRQFDDLMTLPDDQKKLNQVGRRIVAPGTPLSRNAIEMYMELSNDDPVKATQLAEEDGYDFPK